MVEANAHLLVVDDDARLRELLRRYLTEQGFRVTVAEDAAAARARLGTMLFDAVVLDVMMPGDSGLVLTREIRAGSRMPILLLTAMGEPGDRVDGLEHGADDYLTKPFEPRELVLRLRNLVRRVAAAGAREEEAPAPLLRFGPFLFDRSRQVLSREGEPVRLTQVEGALLLALSERPGEAVEREALAETALVGGGARAVDVQMTRLRRKVEPDPKYPRWLQTVRGTGYRLVIDG